MSGSKPRLRISAGSSAKRWATNDSFQNFAASLGYGTSNMSSGGTYGFNPITRNHTMLEWSYRGSWLVKVVVDAVAEDMTRERIAVESDMPPDELDRLDEYMEEMLIWQRLTETIKWSRLYGGCLAVIMIDGQKPETPLRIDTVGKNQFKGLMVLDRWMVWPHLDDPVQELGKDYGMPRFYEVVSDARVIPHMKIHHSRCIRFDGVELPYWQRMAENYWGLSVIEPLWDRLLAFDSATQGAAQLVYRAHLRTLYVEKLRELIAYGGDAFRAVVEQMRNIRLYQSNEGLTLLDATDKFETHSYAFGGLSDVLIQFAQQLSGAAQIPLVRLFGQSPAGLNATGDADIRNYYDFINSQQEDRLRGPVRKLLELSYRSMTGQPLPEGFDFTFAPLWQLADTEKADVATKITQAVTAAQGAGIISNSAALKELRQSSKTTGVFSNITDEEIKEADLAPPPIMGEPPIAGEQPGAEQEQDDAAPNIVKMPSARAALVRGLLPAHALGHPSGIDDREDIHSTYGHLHPREELKRQFPLPDAIIPVSEPITHVQDSLPPMVEVHGIPIVIETRKNERRQGNGWSVQMPAHYGYFQATKAVDGDQLDCFVGDDLDSTTVWVIEQNDPRTGAFDEHKVMIGFPDRDTAINTYKAAYEDGAEGRIGAVRRMNLRGLQGFISEMSPVSGVA